MATNNKELAASIVELLGGSSNISTALHCVTRLRFNLRDDSLAKLDDIRQLKGVLGAQIKDGQYQVIIGPNVNRVYDEVVPLLDSSAAADKPSSAGKVKGAQVLDIITGIFSAILPALVAGGMLKGLLALAEIFGVNTGGGTCQILSMISDVPFYFLPFLLAISAARKFKVNEYLGVCMAGALMYPTFVEAVGADPSPFTFLGIAVPVFSYADSVFPVILGVGLLAIVYHIIDRFIPDVLKMVLVPMLSLVISVPLTLLVFAPLGAYGGLALADGIVWLFSLLGPVAGFLLGFFMPLIVLFGMHQSTSPIQISNIATLGYDYLLPVSFCHNMAESGAAFGAALCSPHHQLFRVPGHFRACSVHRTGAQQNSPHRCYDRQWHRRRTDRCFGCQVLCLCHAGHYFTAHLCKRRRAQSADDGRLHRRYLCDRSDPLLHPRRKAG